MAPPQPLYAPSAAPHVAPLRLLPQPLVSPLPTNQRPSAAPLRPLCNPSAAPLQSLCSSRSPSPAPYPEPTASQDRAIPTVPPSPTSTSPSLRWAGSTTWASPPLSPSAKEHKSLPLSALFMFAHQPGAPGALPPHPAREPRSLPFPLLLFLSQRTFTQDGRPPNPGSTFKQAEPSRGSALAELVGGRSSTTVIPLGRLRPEQLMVRACRATFPPPRTGCQHMELAS